MRIGFDITPLTVPRSGVGTYTASLLSQLQRGSNDIVPLSHYPAGYRWSGSGNGLHNWARKKTLWMQWGVRRQVKEQKLDLCHFTNHVAPLWLQCPFVLTIHDMTLWLYPSLHPRRRLVAMRPFMPLAARQAEAIITVSHSSKVDIVNILGVRPEKVSVIYEAPAPIFQPLNGSTAMDSVMKKYKLPESFILHVGTLEPRKNIVRLLEAYAQLHHQGSLKHHLVFAGQQGWGFENIFSTVEALDIEDQTHFLGFVPDRQLVGLYNLAALLIYPSIYEGFGLPVVEAMASGTPVITSPNGALEEIAGEAAAYVDPEDAGCIAEILHMVLSDESLQRELAEKGLARASDFSWERAAKSTEGVYGQVLNSEGAWAKPPSHQEVY